MKCASKAAVHEGGNAEKVHVKDSCVHDRCELLANTFLKPFQAVAGMARLYQDCYARGGAFHYVSGSPWQLYPPLSEFFEDALLPPGSFDLKDHELGRKSSLEDFDAQSECSLRRSGIPSGEPNARDGVPYRTFGTDNRGADRFREPGRPGRLHVLGGCTIMGPPSVQNLQHKEQR